MNIIVCPVCGHEMTISDGALHCAAGHSFDIAKEGYVNLLAGAHKAGNTTGDSRSMAASRKAFLNKGYYDILRNAVVKRIGEVTPHGGSVLDICCGEGYYTSAFGGDDRSVYGLDLSKEMVRLAAKRDSVAQYFVANISSIPVRSGSVDTAVHMFAPFHDAEFSRILSDGGRLISVVPGQRHLWGMKKALYDQPYENDEQPPAAPSFVCESSTRVCGEAVISGKEDIAAVFGMTPYCVRSPQSGKKRLQMLDSLVTPVEFVIFTFRKIIV